MPTVTIRTAQADDIPALTELIDIATGGFIWHVLAEIAAPGEDLESMMTGRMLDPASQLYFEKAQVADKDGRIAGFVMTEPIADPADLTEPGAPEVLKSLLELENLASGTRLINFVATFPAWRGRGLGTALMARAEQDRGPNGMSLTIHDLNTDARRLYERLGFREAARRPIVRGSWPTAATEWVLMIKP